jgi:methionine-R-sulfoxide reductase
MQLSDQEWQAKLTPEQYAVLRQKGTEAPFSGKLLHEQGSGVYTCAACGTTLFKSDAKYETGTPGLMGWPSFSDVVAGGTVELKDDNSWGMHRKEAVCKTCGSHLGHLFDDPTSPTNQHYCINSCALDFKPKG